MPRVVVLVVIIGAAGCAWAQERPGDILKTEVAVKPGEICIGCNHPIEAHDKTYLVEGQRVAVHRADCDNSLRADPTPFLARLKPRGGFFGGEKAPAGAPGSTGLLVGVGAVVGLGLAGIWAHRTLNRSASPAGDPIPAGLAKIPSTRAPQACPLCGATNHPAASQCLECKAPLRPDFPSEVSRLKSTLK